MREYGLLDRTQSKVYGKKPVCEAHGQIFDSVRIIDCYAALLILAYGFIAAVMLLLGERIAASKECGQFRCEKRDNH